MATLNEQQKYLLNRIPGQYSYKHPTIADSAEVKQARKVIAAFEERTQKESSQRKSKFLRAIRAAREAVYFKQPEKALELIKGVESDFLLDGDD
jgi:hypothetical protein